MLQFVNLDAKPPRCERLTPAKSHWAKALATSREEILKRLAKPEHRPFFPIDLLQKLKSFLSNDRPRVFVFVDMRSVNGWSGFASGYCVTLRPRNFNVDLIRLNAILLHELVHVAGGLELDAEYYENLLFPKHDKGTPPDLQDLTEFKKKLREGKKDEYQGYWLYLDMKGLPKKSADIITLWRENTKAFLGRTMLP